MPQTFDQKLRQVQARKASALCVGLDPDPARMPRSLLERYAPAEAVLAFNTAVVEATQAAACAYKLNLAFYEVLGKAGWDVLARTIAHLPDDVLVVADAKRGDIGNSARFYAHALYRGLGCDACTVSPYMGRDSVDPFLQDADRAAFVLGRTSNAGGADFQTLTCGDAPLYLQVARRVAEWDAAAPGTAGLVVGATDLDALAALRAACPTLPFLIPGVGAQGGDPNSVMQAAATERGLVLVNSSRSILYASGGEDFAEAAAREAEALREVLAPVW